MLFYFQRRSSLMKFCFGSALRVFIQCPVNRILITRFRYELSYGRLGSVVESFLNQLCYLLLSRLYVRNHGRLYRKCIFFTGDFVLPNSLASGIE